MLRGVLTCIVKYDFFSQLSVKVSYLNMWIVTPGSGVRFYRYVVTSNVSKFRTKWVFYERKKHHSKAACFSFCVVVSLFSDRAYSVHKCKVQHLKRPKLPLRVVRLHTTGRGTRKSHSSTRRDYSREQFSLKLPNGILQRISQRSVQVWRCWRLRWR